jgi:hypothetical protein
MHDSAGDVTVGSTIVANESGAYGGMSRVQGMNFRQTLSHQRRRERFALRRAGFHELGDCYGQFTVFRHWDSPLSGVIARTTYI